MAETRILAPEASTIAPPCVLHRGREVREL
jgi:hypothetical protein